jgi:hypothetical protein
LLPRMTTPTPRQVSRERCLGRIIDPVGQLRPLLSGTELIRQSRIVSCKLLTVPKFHPRINVSKFNILNELWNIVLRLVQAWCLGDPLPRMASAPPLTPGGKRSQNLPRVNRPVAHSSSGTRTLLIWHHTVIMPARSVPETIRRDDATRSPQTWARQTLLVNSKARGKAVL